MALDQTWQVGLAWGIVIIALTVAGAWAAFKMGMTPWAMVLGLVGWVAFVGWLEKGVTK